MQEKKRFAVVRLRGSVGVREEVEDTLKMLRLYKVHHTVIIDNRPSYLGMLQKVKDYVTWGEVDAETLAAMLKKRGRLIGNKKLSDEIVQKYTPYKTIEEFAKAIVEFKAELGDIPILKPVFRLHPPKGGLKGSKKRPYPDGGELGYRGEAINDLLKKMI